MQLASPGTHARELARRGAGTRERDLAAFLSGPLVLLVLPAAYAVAIYFSGIFLEPDASYYTGGIALFPSPLGTVLGTIGGYTGLALLNAAATFAIMLLVALIAAELGNPPLLAQGLVLLLVPAGWFVSWGMDAPAAALLLAAVLLHLRGRSRGALALVALGSMTHLAALPLAVGALVTRVSWRLSLAVGGLLLAAGAGVAYLTPYRTGFGVVRQPGAFVEGGHEVILASWPLLVVLPFMAVQPRARLLLLGSLPGAVLAGAVPASVGQLGLTRYAVPCVILAVATLRFRRSLLPAFARVRLRAIGSRRQSRYALPAAGAWRDS